MPPIIARANRNHAGAASITGSRAAPATYLAIVALVVVGIGAASSVYELRREHAIATAQEQLLASVQFTARRGLPIGPPPPLNLAQQPRALLLDAQLYLNQVPFAQDAADKRRLLSMAQRTIAAALAGRPGWGEAEALEAYLQSLKGSEGKVAAQRALVRSYDHMPYMREAAAWRIRYGLAQWGALPDATQRRIVDEAIWFVRLRPEQRDSIFAAVRATPAYFPFMLRWRTVRAFDADRLPN